MTPERERSIRAQFKRGVFGPREYAHVRDLLSEIDRLRAENAALKEERDKEILQHAACLSVAEGAPGWDMDRIYGFENSPAIKAVQALRRSREKLREAAGRADELLRVLPDHPDIQPVRDALQAALKEKA